MGELIRGWMANKVSVTVDGFFDFVDVRDVARGHILACENGRRGATYILGGERVSLEWMWRIVSQVTGLRASSIKIPMPLAIIGSWFAPLYYRLARSTPRFTRYALETVQSNSHISIARARRELGTNPARWPPPWATRCAGGWSAGGAGPGARPAGFAAVMKPGLAIVSGASSGIGAATARALSAHGWRLVLAARRAGRLEQLAGEINAAGGQAEIFPVDLADPGGREALFAAHPQADLLVNNAGLGWYGYVEKMSWNVAQEMIAVNMAACVQLCQLYLPGMRARRRGHIINVGSIVGAMPNQGVALYSASKAFLDTFTTAVYRELRGSGVEISVVRPGPVQSEFFERARGREQGGSIPAERFAIPAKAIANCILGAGGPPAQGGLRALVYGLFPLAGSRLWLADRPRGASAAEARFSRNPDRKIIIASSAACRAPFPRITLEWEHRRPARRPGRIWVRVYPGSCIPLYTALIFVAAPAILGGVRGTSA